MGRLIFHLKKRFLLLVCAFVAAGSWGCVKKYSPSPDALGTDSQIAIAPESQVSSKIYHYEFVVGGSGDGRLSSFLIDPQSGSRTKIVTNPLLPVLDGDPVKILVDPDSRRNRIYVLTQNQFAVADFDLETGQIGSIHRINLNVESHELGMRDTITDFSVSGDGKSIFISAGYNYVWNGRDGSYTAQALSSLQVLEDGSIVAGTSPAIVIPFRLENFTALSAENSSIFVVRGPCHSYTPAGLDNFYGTFGVDLATYQVNADTGAVRGPLDQRTIDFGYAFKKTEFSDLDAGACGKGPASPMVSPFNSNRVVFGGLTVEQFHEVSIDPVSGRFLGDFPRYSRVGVDSKAVGNFPTLVVGVQGRNLGPLSVVQIDDSNTNYTWAIGTMGAGILPIGVAYPSIEGSLVYINGIKEGSTTDFNSYVGVYRPVPGRGELALESTHFIGPARSLSAYAEVLKGGEEILTSSVPAPVGNSHRLAHGMWAQLPSSAKAWTLAVPSPALDSAPWSAAQAVGGLLCVTQSGLVKCRASSQEGAVSTAFSIGNGPLQVLPEFTFSHFLKNVKDFSFSKNHACAIESQDLDPQLLSLVCYGDNGRGQLGLMTQSSLSGSRKIWFPTPAFQLENAQTGTDSVGKLTTRSVVRTTNGRTFVTTERGVVAWGLDISNNCVGCENSFLTLVARLRQELPSVRDFRVLDQEVDGQHSVCALLDTGAIECWNDALEVRPKTKVPLEPVVQLVGSSSYCALDIHGSVYCWDDYRANSIFPIALTEVALGIESSGDMKFNACALLKSGNVECWGRVFDRQMMRPSLPMNFPNLKGAAQVWVEGSKFCGHWPNGDINCGLPPAGFPN